MNNKPWKNAQTAIELTSLLDVIFIVLMIVVCNQQISTTAQVEQAAQAVTEAEARELAAEAREANAELLEAEAQKKLEEAAAMQAQTDNIVAEKDFYAEQLDTYENLTNQVLAVTLYVEYQPGDPKEREIRILAGTGEQEAIELNPENSTEAWNELERRLGALLQENKDIPVILTVNKSQMLYRDEKKVSELLEKLSGSHSNLYRKAEAAEQ